MSSPANKRSHYIQKVEVHSLQNLPFNISKISMDVIAGGIIRRSPTFKVPSETPPTWSVRLDVGDLDASTSVKFKLYSHGRSPLTRKKLFGHAEKSMSDIFNRKGVTVSLFSNASPESEICSIKIFHSDDLTEAAEERVKEIAKPVTQLERVESLLSAAEPINAMVDLLSEVHPTSKIAWSLLLNGFDTFKKQKTGLLSETIEIVVDVYDAMLLTYEEAIREEVLKKRDKLHCVYDTLFKQTIECSYFIKGYANKSVTGRVLSRNLLDKAKEFHEGFTALRDKLQSGISTETPVVTLGIRQLVDDLTRTDLNRNLRPLTEFCPTSTCMKGTRVETINVLMSWIADCSGGMLWCSGLAGTGKSSLAGTLHELLTTGGRNRLGAYLHYDHLGYSDASHLITSIAYSLGMYDNRIGTSISGVIRRNSALLSMSTASASEQFRALLQEPLERLPDLVNEGPLIVMIDGIDESDASKELLAVLSKGFGLRLPFIRLLVFSRSTETIFQAFSAPNSAVTTIVLNTTSEEISHDIRFFIGYHFSDIFANLSARNGSNDLQEFCEMFHAVDGLTERASGLLIWAATACRFIRESPSTSRLFALLDISASVDTLTFLYRTILDTIVSETDDHVVTTQSIRAVLGALVVKTPEGMTARALDTLVLLPEDTPARSILARLGSVIHETSTGYHQFFHSSFYDFLQNRSQCGDQWYIDVNEYKDRLHKRRWEVLKTMRSGTSGDLSSLL